MKKSATHLRWLPGAVLAVLLGLAASDQAQAGVRCYANWSEAAPVVVRERLVSARDIHQLVRKSSLAKVVRITLCRTGQGYKYKLVVFGPDGKARKLILDARRPVVR